jgi:hypothetical protein
VLRLESIFIGAQVVSLRITVVEAEAEEHKSGHERYLTPSRPEKEPPSFLRPNNMTLSAPSFSPPPAAASEEDEGYGSDGSLGDREAPGAETPPPEKPKPKRVPKKTIKKKIDA